MTSWKRNHLFAICCPKWQKKWPKQKSQWILKSTLMLIFCNRYKKENWPTRLLLPHSSLTLAKFQPWQRLCEPWCQWWSLVGRTAAWPLLPAHSFTSLVPSCLERMLQTCKWGVAAHVQPPVKHPMQEAMCNVNFTNAHWLPAHSSVVS